LCSRLGGVGAHQVYRPDNLIVAGTSTIRTTVERDRQDEAEPALRMACRKIAATRTLAAAGLPGIRDLQHVRQRAKVGDGPISTLDRKVIGWAPGGPRPSPHWTARRPPSRRVSVSRR
jgi:hypothetical protein